MDSESLARQWFQKFSSIQFQPQCLYIGCILLSSALRGILANLIARQAWSALDLSQLGCYAPRSLITSQNTQRLIKNGLPSSLLSITNSFKGCYLSRRFSRLFQLSILYLDLLASCVWLDPCTVLRKFRTFSQKNLVFVKVLNYIYFYI